MSNREEPIFDTEDIVDNQGKLPVWWMSMFWGAIAWSIVYFIWLHPVASWNQHQMFAAEVEQYNLDHPVEIVELTPEGQNPFSGDAQAIADGEKQYKIICAACHKVDATGLIGPNLTDNVWLHSEAGSTITNQEMFDLIMIGIDMDNIKQDPPMGVMLPHKDSLGSKKVLQVMAYLETLNDTIVD